MERLGWDDSEISYMIRLFLSRYIYLCKWRSPWLFIHKINQDPTKLIKLLNRQSKNISSGFHYREHMIYI